MIGEEVTVIQRPTHRGIGLVSATALLVAALVGPIPVGATTPDADADVSAVPSVVLNGARGAFVATFDNTDSSTISQLYLIGSVSGAGVTFVRAYPSQGTCSASSVSCTLGQVKPNGPLVTVTIVYQTTAATTAVSGAFAFNTVGLGSGGGDSSHGDSWPVSASASTSSDPDFGGRFIDSDANLVVQNDQSVNDSSNRHATKVVAPKSFIGVTVEDGSVETQVCPPAPGSCDNLFGETSIVSVAAGGTFPGGFQIVITFDSSELVGVNANNLRIWHTYSGGSELISSKCSFASGASTPTSMPCLVTKKLPGSDLRVTIWTTHNGVLRGYK